MGPALLVERGEKGALFGIMADRVRSFLGTLQETVDKVSELAWMWVEASSGWLTSCCGLL